MKVIASSGSALRSSSVRTSMARSMRFSHLRVSGVARLTPLSHPLMSPRTQSLICAQPAEPCCGYDMDRSRAMRVNAVKWFLSVLGEYSHTLHQNVHHIVNWSGRKAVLMPTDEHSLEKVSKVAM